VQRVWVSAASGAIRCNSRTSSWCPSRASFVTVEVALSRPSQVPSALAANLPFRVPAGHL
jgi:hypothetical protein